MEADYDFYMQFFLLTGGLLCLLLLAGFFGLQITQAVILRAFACRPVPRTERWETLYDSVERLSRRMNMPCPRLFFLQEFSPNALAVPHWRGSRACIVLSDGLVQALSLEELEAVISLCLAQLRLRDFLGASMIAFFALPLARIAAHLPDGFAVLVEAFTGAIIRLAVSPRRILRADRHVVESGQAAAALAAAIRKMNSLGRRVPLTKRNFALDHLFLISTMQEGMLPKIWPTHPDPEERIQRLLASSVTC